ncbi:hypothetical protein IQ225_05225, partial [Synechocystis salina LEGE 06155]|nr:hypothetical protein [Synechocystis salina LEGE 06155]
MKTKNLAFLGLLGAAGISSLAFAPSAEAVLPLFSYSVAGVFNTEETGTSFSGGFTYDSSTGMYDGISITTLSGTNASDDVFSAITYTSYNPSLSNASRLVLVNADNVFNLLFRSAPTGGTSVNLNTTSAFVRGSELQGGGFPSRNINASLSGVSGTPVPFNSNEFPLVASGVLLAGGFWLKRKRGQAKIQLPVAEPQP